MKGFREGFSPPPGSDKKKVRSAARNGKWAGADKTSRTVETSGTVQGNPSRPNQPQANGNGKKRCRVCPWRECGHRQVCGPDDTTRRFGTGSSLRGSILADTTCRATVRSSRKARCLKTPHPAAVAAPTDKRGFVTPKFREQCASTPPRFRAGWAYPQGWPHGFGRVLNIPLTCCA